jgi:spore germination protein KB
MIRRMVRGAGSVGGAGSKGSGSGDGKGNGNGNGPGPKIGKYQLAAAIILFEIGSTPMFLLGIEAKQNAWLSMLFGAAAGLIVLLPCLYLQRLSGDADWTDMLRRQLGRGFGGFIAVLYVILLAYESMRNVRDFGIMAQAILLPQTPMWLVMGIVTAVACYAVRSGIIVLFRMIELFFPAIVLSTVMIILLFFFTGLPDHHRLLPFLDNGIGPVIGQAIPERISFPFGEVFVFLLFWRYASEPKQVMRTSVTAYAIVSVFLVGMSALTLSILGANVASVMQYPFIEAVQLIQLADFLERLDIVVTLVVFFGLFVKLSVFYMASNLIASSMTGISKRVCAVVIGAAIYAAAFLEPNQTFHIWLGLQVQPHYSWIYQAVVPLLVLAIAMLRRRGKGGAGAGVGAGTDAGAGGDAGASGSAEMKR